MEDAEIVYNFIFVLICFCIVYPPEEFVALGLTVENCFSGLLGSKDVEFIRYHQKRTALNLVVHSCLPVLYFLIHFLKFVMWRQHFEDEEEPIEYTSVTWIVAQRFSVLAMLAVPALVLFWSMNDWWSHPISRTLRKFANTPSNHATVASDINNEYRRQGVFKMKVNSISSVVATENWIIKTTPYNVFFAHQSDTTLSVDKSETYHITQDTSDALQIISINVKSGRPGVADFRIRINALEFRTLEDRISRPIIIPSNIQFHRNIIDRFIEVFKAQVALNPTYTADQVTEKCFACMIAEPNIKIHKQCLDETPDGQQIPPQNRCTNCYCRPMWCVDCLARWFAARQNEYERDVWLEKKCTCPMCRAPFCLLDISFIEKRHTNVT